MNGPYQEQYPPTWLPSNECSSQPIVKHRYGTRSSSGTESSPTGGKTTNVMAKKKSCRPKPATENFQSYGSEAFHNGKRHLKSLTSNKEVNYSSPKPGKRFVAMHESRSNYPHFGNSKRAQLQKEKKIGSIDSEYPEDERRKAFKKTRYFSSPSVWERRHWSPQYCSDRSVQSETVGKRTVAHSPNSPLHTIYVSESSNDEVFQSQGSKESSNCDSEVASYDVRKRRERHGRRNRPSVPETSQWYPANGTTEVTTNGCSPGGRQIYQAIAMYQAMSNDTIDLFEGDQVQVVRKTRGGWWYVRIDNEEGWAPSNYLEPITCYCK